jgi:multidrug efflux pump subunit AcrA (membrane-fusion protein)
MKGPALLVPLLLSLTACSRDRGIQAAEGLKPIAVRTEAAQVRDVRRQVDVIGTLAAREEVVVSAEVAGRVSRLVHDLGDRVAAGTPLLELDPEKLQYRADGQRAALDQARARYGAAGDGELPALDKVPAVVSTRAQLADAQQQFDRAKNLASRNLLSRSDLETAQTRFDTARAAHDQAMASARQLRADIEAQSSSLRLAQRELRDAVIRAPFDGYVAERLVSPGQYVQPQAAVMRIVRLQPLKLTAEVPEKFAPWIETGREMAVKVDAFPQQVFAGKVVRIAPGVNLKSRAFAIEGEVPNPDGKLKPGTFARVQITTDRVDRAVTIPVAAVQSRYGTNRVFLVQNGQLAGREVVLGDRLGDRVEVSLGLEAGTQIVASDVEQLADGTKVTAK